MVRGARELLAVRDPLDAELLVSEVLGTWWGQRVDSGDVEQVVGEALVEYAARSEEPAALALLTGIARLGTPAQAEAARAGAQRLAETVRPPPWAGRIGPAIPGECWVSRDVYGDQDSVICTFHYQNQEREPHALIVLVDYNLDGMAKDAWCTSKVTALLDHCRREAAANPLVQFESLSPARARAILDTALRETDSADDPPVSKSFPGYHAFVRARVSALPAGGEPPAPPRFGADERAALAVEFLASPEAESLSDTAAAGRCADLIIDYGHDADGGRPVRVSPMKVERFLLDWLPRKVLLRGEDREAMPHVLAAWVRWAARKTGLPRSGLTQTLDALWEASRWFEDTYGDPYRLGLDSGTVDRLVPDGDLEALPRRAFAVPLLTGKCGDVDLGTLDPADPGHRRILVECEHRQCASSSGGAHGGAAGTRAGGVSSSHVSLHEIVAAQLWQGDPSETWDTAQRLLDCGYERHDVLHMLMAALDRAMHGDPVGSRSYNPEAFRAALAQLPTRGE